MRALIPWKSTRELETISRRMDDMFDRLTQDFFGPGWWERPREETTGWEPVIECHVENGNLIIRVDLPGVDAKDVNISVLGNQLTIEGERKQEKKEKEIDYLYRELPYGKFMRKTALPDGVDVEKIKTAYKNGVLEITMPAPKQLVSKKIPIEVQS